MAQKCKNCAWFCHTDGRCYGNKMNVGLEIFSPADQENRCPDWTFDGLEDWEREETEALMAMEAEIMR